MHPTPELEIVKVPIDELVPYEGNAKLHPNEQVDQIATSINDLGFNSPILAWHDEDGDAVIVAGHGRLMAARELGMTELPVVFLDHLTDEQRRAYTLIDNQLTMNSGFDFQLLNEELDAIVDIDMRDFGFDPFEPMDAMPDIDLPENVVDDDDAPRKARTVTCPACGEVFEP